MTAECEFDSAEALAAFPTPDFAAGNLSDRDLIVILVVIAALILIIVAVR